jgi:hypothetical protein
MSPSKKALIAPVRTQPTDVNAKSTFEPKGKGDRRQIPHSKEYAPRGISSDALHHYRLGRKVKS